MTKREPKQEEPAHMALSPLPAPGQYEGRHVVCDYCDADAVWFHWASTVTLPDRDCYACAEHVHWLDSCIAPT